MEQLVAGFVFLVTYAVILSERIHRTIAGLMGAVVMVALGMVFGFYSQEEALESIDANTLGLLMGMMVLAALLAKTGFFGYLAIVAAKRTRGNPWHLMLVLGTITTLLSMLVDNVTTVVLMAPLTLLIADLMRISPVPLLLAEALLSDTGGVATLVGDPPNIMIGSAAGLSFNDFLTHLAPIVLVAWLATLLLLRFVFRSELSRRTDNLQELLEMDERAALTDPAALKKILVSLGFVLVLFFVHHRLHLLPSFAALAGAALALLWVRPNPEEIFKEVEWSVLVFFGSLFVMVGGLERAGILGYVANFLTTPVEGNVVLAGVIIIWVAAVASAVVDNIPFTLAMIPVIQHLETQGINVGPLWWALALGVGFGGNGTPIGSTANVVVVSVSEKTPFPITTRVWLKSGSLAMLATCAVGSALFALAYGFF